MGFFAALAPAAAALGPLGIAAAGLGAIGSIVGGISARNAAKARARQLELQAQQTRNESGIAAGMGLVEDDRQAGHAAVIAAANGGGFDGSVANVLDDLRSQSLFKARSTVYRGATQAANSEYEAAVSRQEGRNALIQSGIQAGSSLLSSFAGAAQAKSLAAAGAGRGR